MKKRIFAVIIVAFMLFSAVSFGCETGKNSESIWKEFRQEFPFHIQVVAMSRPDGRETRTMIISEPPPHVTLEGLKKLSPTLFADLKVMKHSIGYDGWVKDVVTDIPAKIRPDELRRLIDSIHQYLFYTDYKADVLLVPVSKSEKKKYDLDYQISHLDLKQWLIDSKEKFVSLKDEKQFSFDDMLKHPGVYFSQSNGFVLWAIPQGADIDNYLAEARQFALDSDLILGAISEEDNLVIVGRERMVPAHILPPVRTETLRFMTDKETDKLGQSIDLLYTVAGRLSDGTDWAPVYLSKALLDTEYGNLLIIADQLLKSWSENGRVSFNNFNYPNPEKWAFEKPLIELLKPFILIYNLDNSETLYSVNIDKYKLVALPRTGSLRVNYLKNGQNVPDIEKIGYEFFCQISDPIFIKVLQYNTLFLLFKKHNIYVEKYDFYSPQPDYSAMQDNFSKILTEIINASEYEINNISEKFANKAIKEYKENKSTINELIKNFPGVDPSMFDLTNYPPSFVQYGFYTQIMMLRSDLWEGYESWGEEAISTLSSFLANPRDPYVQKQLLMAGTEINSDRQMKFWISMMYHSLSLPNRELLQEFYDVNKIKNDYINSFNVQERRWIRTPTIVISKYHNPIVKWMGGHNIHGLESVWNVEVRSDIKSISADSESKTVSVPISKQYQIPYILNRINYGEGLENIPDSPSVMRKPFEALGIIKESALNWLDPFRLRGFQTSQDKGIAELSKVCKKLIGKEDREYAQYIGKQCGNFTIKNIAASANADKMTSCVTDDIDGTVKMIEFESGKSPVIKDMEKILKELSDQSRLFVYGYYEGEKPMVITSWGKMLLSEFSKETALNEAREVVLIKEMDEQEERTRAVSRFLNAWNDMMNILPTILTYDLFRASENRKKLEQSFKISEDNIIDLSQENISTDKIVRLLMGHKGVVVLLVRNNEQFSQAIKIASGKKINSPTMLVTCQHSIHDSRQIKKQLKDGGSPEVLIPNKIIPEEAGKKFCNQMKELVKTRQQFQNLDDLRQSTLEYWKEKDLENKVPEDTDIKYFEGWKPESLFLPNKDRFFAKQG
jgi:hypothetical protein